MRLLLCLTLVGCVAPSQKKEETTTVLSGSCTVDTDCDGGLCRNGICTRSCKTDEDCDTSSMCIMKTCTAKVPPSIHFAEGAGIKMWAGEPVKTIAPVVDPGPQSTTYELRFRSLLAPEGAPAIAGTEPGAAPRASIQFDPAVRGYYIIEATASHASGTASAELIIEVQTDTTFAYLVREGADGVSAISTDGQIQILANALGLDALFFSGSASLDSTRVAFAFESKPENLPGPVEPVAVTGDAPCSGGDVEVNGKCCPSDKTNLFATSCCPADFLLVKQPISEANPNGDPRCVYQTLAISAQGRIASTDGKSDRTFITAHGARAGTGATCAFSDAVVVDGPTECNYNVSLFSANAGGTKLAVNLMRSQVGQSMTEQAVLLFDLTAPTGLTLGTTGATAPPPAMVMVSGDSYDELDLSPNGQYLITDDRVYGSGNFTGRTIKLRKLPVSAPIRTIDVKIPGTNRPANGNWVSQAKKLSNVLDDGRVVYAAADVFLYVSGAEGDPAGTIQPFDLQTNPSYALLPEGERAALRLCAGDCQPYPSPMPAFADAACSADSCCACLRDTANAKDPVVYCKARGAEGKTTVVPWYGGVAPHGARVAVVRSQFGYDTSTCPTIFKQPEDGDTAAEVALVIYEPNPPSPRLPTTVVPLTFLPADLAESRVAPPVWLADGAQLGLLMARGVDADARAQLWVLNGDGSRPRQILPANTRAAYRQSAFCNGGGDAAWLLVALAFFLRRRPRAKR